MASDPALDRWPQGTPLEPPLWYLDPVLIEDRDDGYASRQIQQGDVFLHIAHLSVADRPVRAFYDDSRANLKHPYRLAPEDELRGPEGSVLDLDGGLWPGTAVTKAEMGIGVVITQDSELQKRRPTVIFARIRPVSEAVEEAHVELIRNRRVYRSFFLPAATVPKRFPASIVDFGRLTTFEMGAVRFGDRYLSLHDDVRDCLRRDFSAFLLSQRQKEGL
jgi:hypothetical protein